MAAWRIVVHALDRTGPPMLARSLLRWAVENRPGDSFDVIAFRGGELIDSMVELAPVHVVLDPSEAWSASDPSQARTDALRRRLARLRPADATLLVSVAAGQVVPMLADGGPIVVWSVEQGEDLHWIDEPLGLVERARRWIAGSDGTARDLREKLPRGAHVVKCVEFIERPEPLPASTIANCRAALDVDRDDLLVLGAGIGTSRKGVDLFAEVAGAARRRGLERTRFGWLGGERDDLYWRVRHETERLGVDVRWFGSVTDVDPWLAAADVFVQSARLDSFPLICLHAAVAGTPVVSFAGVGGTEEMFGDAFLGCPYPDVPGIVELIEQLRDHARRHRVGDAQRNAVTGRFTSDVAASAVMAELDAVVASPTPTGASL